MDSVGGWVFCWMLLVGSVGNFISSAHNYPDYIGFCTATAVQRDVLFSSFLVPSNRFHSRFYYGYLNNTLMLPCKGKVDCDVCIYMGSSLFYGVIPALGCALGCFLPNYGTYCNCPPSRSPLPLEKLGLVAPPNVVYSFQRSFGLFIFILTKWLRVLKFFF